MKLREHFGSILSKVKKIIYRYPYHIIAICCLLLLVCVCILFGNMNSGTHTEADDGKIQLCSESISGGTELNESDYRSVCAAYNDSVAIYNEEIEKFNQFVDRLEPYELLMTPAKKERLDVVPLDYINFLMKEKDIQEVIDKEQTIRDNYEFIKECYPRLYLLLLNEEISNFNTIVNEFNELMPNTSVDFITAFPAKLFKRDLLSDNQEYSEEEFFHYLDKISKDTLKILGDYKVLFQITSPSEEWVIEKLDSIDRITYRKAVTKDHDPNGMLGKEGGYSCCIYFNVKDIALNSVKGSDLVDKGTAAGGAIEVYPTLESAKNRCEYLSQFDGSLLYSGSYVLIGTMVVRTSYLLDNEDQVEITTAIVEAFTST